MSSRSIPFQPTEIEAMVASHKRWLNNEPGSRADFRKADLSGADLRGADLSDSDMEGADISNADLTGADLTNSNLQRKDIMTAGAFLEGATMPDGRSWEDYRRNVFRF